MSPKTETLENSLLYSRYDFPEIGFGNHEVYVTWKSHGKNDLSEQLENGIQVSEEDHERLDVEFKELEEKYGLDTADYKWVERDNGMSSLIWVRTHIAKDFTNIWGARDDFKGTCVSLSSHDKLHSGEFSDTKEAIFLLECLSHYLKYSGIEFPHIRTKFLEILETTFHEVVHEERLFEYYFSIPFVEDFDYNRVVSLQSWLNDKKVLVGQDNISIDGEIVGCLIEKDGEKFWDIGNIYDSSIAVVLFHVVGYPLKWRLLDKD